jgi:predicted transcriptional regulator
MEPCKDDLSPTPVRLVIIILIFAPILVSLVQYLGPNVSAQPSIAVELGLNSSVVEAGDEVICRMFFNNTGNNVTPMAWINVSIPFGMSYVSDNSSSEGGVKTGDYNWTFSNVGVDYHGFDVFLLVSPNVQGGQLMTISANLDYLSEIHTPMPPSSAFAATNVREISLSLALSEKNVTTGPSDVFAFDIELENQSPLPAYYALLNVYPPNRLQYVSDNASDAGGIKIGDYCWEFRNITQGRRSFTLVNHLDSGFVDGWQLNMTIRLEYANRNGVVFPTIEDVVNITVSSPELSLEVTSDRATYESSDTLEFSIHLNNTGSDSAETVWTNLSIPSFPTFVSDTSNQIGGSSTGYLRYMFTNLSTGSHEFRVLLKYEGEVDKLVYEDIWAFANYTDGNGDFVGEVNRRTGFGIVWPSEEFPVVPVVLTTFLVLGIAIPVVLTRESAKYSILLFIVPLFSRLTKREVLNNETRGMIRGYVTANPGDHFNAIKAALNLKNGTLAHHLRILEREKIVKSAKDGKYRRFFPAGMKITEKAYLTKIEKLIMSIVRETPGITRKDIAGRLGMSRPAVSYHINKLKKSRKIRTEKRGMSLKHYVRKPAK